MHTKLRHCVFDKEAASKGSNNTRALMSLLRELTIVNVSRFISCYNVNYVAFTTRRLTLFLFFYLFHVNKTGCN